MAKRAKTHDTLTLALELLRRIPKNRKVTAKELHSELKHLGMERDERSIQRLLRQLAEQFGIERDERDKPYGYSWKEDSKGFSMPTLTEQESLLLTLAEEHLKNLLPPSLMKSMQGFFAQAKCNLGPHKSASPNKEWLAKVRMVPNAQPLIPAQVDTEVFAQVGAALYANRWLEVDYQNREGHRAEYKVMPLGLAQQGPGLYLVCRFEGHGNERTLALHRMASARATSFTFKRPPEFDLQTYAEDGRFGFGQGQRISLSFVINKGAGMHLLETPLSRDQKVTEVPDGYKVTATVVDTGHLEWWLRGFGDNIQNIRRKPLS